MRPTEMLDLKEVPTKPTILPLNGNADSYALKKHSGLSLWAAAVFVGGNMAGSGVLALPRAVANAGPIGIALIAVFCIASGYLGTRLAMCWVIIEERYPEYKKGVRDPYPTIGFHAFGQFGRILVSITNTISLFGVSIVFLILCSDILTALVRSLLPGYTICTWLLVITLLLIPLSWIGSPKEFTWAGIAALVTTVIASVLSIIQAAIDAPTVSPPPEYPAPGFLSFFLAFGAILFSFGGASTFPTIQIDMKDKTKFPKAVAIAFVGLMLIYFPMATTGYYVYGDSVDSNILNNLSQGPMTVAAQVLIGAHVFSAFIIIFNPVCQELEKALKVPSEMTWKRIVTRTLLMLLALFIAETVPRFGKILDLVGGSTISLLTFILPPLFYMRIVDQRKPEWIERRISIIERIICWVMIAVGTLGGVASTVSAVISITQDSGMDVPCYLQPFMITDNSTAI
ncbi:uncharacterized protein LOC136025283 isoform X2 [Artemia franciscana]|uniref:uncharacterized protein LOC136025283 isoform X2 n=1 Tax=Artemia franciscana TaxID=6661 RepID=UPI0032DBA789